MTNDVNTVYNKYNVISSVVNTYLLTSKQQIQEKISKLPTLRLRNLNTINYDTSDLNLKSPQMEIFNDYKKQLEGSKNAMDVLSTFMNENKIQNMKLSNTPRITEAIPTLNYGLSDQDTNTLRNLQSESTDSLSFQQKMQTIFTSYKFPKMMVIHRDVEVNSRNENPINFIYNFDVLDYLDPITGNPNVFDVYLQKVEIFVDYGGFLFPSEPSKIEFVVVNKIVKNQMDSLSNSGAYLSYKLFSDSKQIFVKYTSITDVLEVFGSFYAIFTLLAQVLSSLFKEVFFNMRLTSSIFKFVENIPGDKNDLGDFILNKENFDMKKFENSYNKNKKDISFGSKNDNHLGKSRPQSMDFRDNVSKNTEMVNLNVEAKNKLKEKDKLNNGKSLI